MKVFLVITNKSDVEAVFSHFDAAMNYCMEVVSDNVSTAYVFSMELDKLVGRKRVDAYYSVASKPLEDAPLVIRTCKIREWEDKADSICYSDTLISAVSNDPEKSAMAVLDIATDKGWPVSTVEYNYEDNINQKE